MAQRHTNITAGTITTVTNLTNAVTLANGAHGGAAATLTLGGAGGLTGAVTGNLSGSVGSVTGAVGSVTGAVGSVTGAVGSVTGNVGGNVTGSVGSIAADGLAAASVAAAAAEKIADIIVRRGNASIEASSFGDALAVKSLYGAIAILTNGVDADTTPGTLSIKKAGGTELGTQTLTGDATADPVVKVVTA